MYRFNEADSNEEDLSDAMIRGNDGRFYFTDHYDIGLITPSSEKGIDMCINVNTCIYLFPSLTYLCIHIFKYSLI
jgi:hypothetical protein